jgi:hypothetical protein
MNKYFAQFPTIQYGKDSLINITNRVSILNQVFGDQYAFYLYQVKNGMRAEQVAEKYYGDPDLVWLVYLSNNIIDPYYQWPMSDEVFNAHIVSNYGSVDAARAKIAHYRVDWYDDGAVIDASEYNDLDPHGKKYWTPQLDQFNQAVTYVRKQIDHTCASYDAAGNVIGLPVPDAEKMYWAPVSYYDIEEEKNADKASIKLLDNRYASTAVSNLKDLLGQ